MNTVTKVFIVLLVVFSIAFTMMTIQFSANVPNWMEEAANWKTKAQLTDTYNRNLTATNVALKAQAAAERTVWDAERGQLTAEIAELESARADLEKRYAKADADRSSFEATVKKLGAQLEIAQTSAEKSREHRDALEARNIELEQRNLDLTNALNEKVATIIVLEQQTRQQEQAISLLKSERDKLMGRGGRGRSFEDSIVTVPTDKVRPAAAPTVTPIRGQIREVDGAFAGISVGSNDGVEVGMVFIVYNQKGYLGDLEVTEVSPNSAAGTLRNLNGRIMKGDMVADESGYMAMSN